MKTYIITANPALTLEQKEILNKVGELTVINARKLPPEEVAKQASDVEILMAGSSGFDGFSDNLFKKLKNLKFISLLTVGTDWIDLAAASENGVVVSNAKGANSESVAEHTWGMILDLSKKITEFDRDVRNKGAYKFTDYKGKEVFGKTIGIIGLGDVGTKVARIASAFDMRVIGTNKSGKEIPGVELVSLEKLLSLSDIIAVCVPLTPETKGMLDGQAFSKMKDGAIVVNTAREDIVDKKSALAAVRSGRLFGYGVETKIMKQIPEGDPYFDYPNIVVTPHNAFNTKDADEKTYDLAISNIEAFLSGNPKNVVTR